MARTKPGRKQFLEPLTFSNGSARRILLSSLLFLILSRVRRHVRVRTHGQGGQVTCQVDNFAVSFFVSKIDRGDLSKSLRVILVSEVLIKTNNNFFLNQYLLWLFIFETVMHTTDIFL